MYQILKSATKIIFDWNFEIEIIFILWKKKYLYKNVLGISLSVGQRSRNICTDFEISFGRTYDEFATKNFVLLILATRTPSTTIPTTTTTSKSIKLNKIFHTEYFWWLNNPEFIFYQSKKGIGNSYMTLLIILIAFRFSSRYYAYHARD